MKRSLALLLPALVIAGLSGPFTQQARAEGVNDNYARTFCLYYKNRTLAARNERQKTALWAEYRRCLKSHGGG